MKTKMRKKKEGEGEDGGEVESLLWSLLYVGQILLIIRHMIKVLERLGIQGTYLNIIKTVDSKPIASINLNRKKCKTIPLKLVTKQGCPFSSYRFNIVLARAMKQPKEFKLERKKSRYLYLQMI